MDSNVGVYGTIRESINLADRSDFVINTVSIAAPYGSSEYMDELIPVTGGKSYSDAAGTGDGLNDLINEVVKDLEDQKAAQRQGDYDGDGLSDGAELDGMLGENGHIYYSNPYTTDVDHDTDGDHVPDNVEMGEYDPATGKYKVKSDPSDPISIPRGMGMIAEPVYIIGWSYKTDEVKKFEREWNRQYSSPELIVDEYNNEWTVEMWEVFNETNAFSRAAQTKKYELIDSGVDPKYIIVVRIDGVDEFYDIWNESWAKQFEAIQELHLYTHGDAGKPQIYNGGLKKGAEDISDLSNYGKLSFTDNAKCYFYGCHIGWGGALQRFANNQKVITYGNSYGTSFSSEVEYRKRITYDDERIYLYSYGVDGFYKPWEDAFLDGVGEGFLAFYSGIYNTEKKIDMIEFIPKTEEF